MDRRIDALSLEVDEKLRSLRSQYAQQLERTKEERGASTIEGGARRAAGKARSKRDKKSSSSSSSSAKTKEVSSRTSKISVTYENGRITNLTTNGDTVIQVKKITRY